MNGWISGNYMIRYGILKWVCAPVAGLFIKDINGLGNLPNKGPYLIVCNHNSSPDEIGLIYIMLKKCQKNIGAITALRPYHSSIINRFFIWLVEKILSFLLTNISVYDGDPVENAIKALQKDVAFLIFPEGKQNYGNKHLLKAKTGAARIALGAKVPIVPVGIRGSEKIIPPYSFIPRFHRMSISIGTPFKVHLQYSEKKYDKKVLEAIGKTYMKEIAKLCAKEYSH